VNRRSVVVGSIDHNALSGASTMNAANPGLVVFASVRVSDQWVAIIIRLIAIIPIRMVRSTGLAVLYSAAAAMTGPVGVD
jgi:hypothetical protein